jgi:Tfp pilus assembly protein PilZ
VGRAEWVVGDVLNMSLGGIFVVASRPLAVGKVIALEMRIAGEQHSVPLSGRVAWRRTVAEEGRPKGMGICFVAVAPTAREVIGRLVTIREPTMYGLGVPEDEPEVPVRLQTVSIALEPDVAPEIEPRETKRTSVFPAREPDTTSVASVGRVGKMRPREASLVFSLVTKKKRSPSVPKR